MDFLSTLIGVLSLVVLVAALLNPLRPLDDSACRSGKMNPTEPTQE
jgi:hypothetical protein